MLGVFVVFSGVAHADLSVIGTANYLGNSYNLIYDNNGPNGPITWLDYISPQKTWQNQVNWADGLGSHLTVTLYPGYTSNIDWTKNWRLPMTLDGLGNYGYDGTTERGLNITSSEMGHLFYTELGNKGWYDINGNLQTYGLDNKGPFQNLLGNYYSYWSGTTWALYPESAWLFAFWYGYQEPGDKGMSLIALAVHPGNVSAVPIPAAMWLLGSGLLGLIGLRRFRK
jgi:hypothetical protein